MSFSRSRQHLDLLSLKIAVALTGMFCVGLELYAETPQAETRWRYQFEKPADAWTSNSFSDLEWSEANGGFGTRGTPGARVATEWDSNDIYLRRTIDVDKLPERPALLIHHDEDAEVFLNGQQVATLNGYTSDYQVVPLDEKARKAIRSGKNLLAIHCHQTTGGQFIDAYLIDANQVPDLPPLPESIEPYRSDLITTWGESITPETAWREYPRPQMVRSQWHNLNGQWDYAVVDRTSAQPTNWEGKILVPFCLESRLSGVQRLLRTTESLWYHRKVLIESTTNVRSLLHFEAVDYRCQVWLNGQLVGEHVGGNLPFSFDVTTVAKDGANDLIVRVDDQTGGAQLRGKQALDPSGIWYTRVSGIWQTAWLEQVPQQYIAEIDTASDIDKGTITVTPTLAGSNDRLSEMSFKVIASHNGRPVAEQTGQGAVTLTVPNAMLWSPNNPQLYDLDISLLNTQGDTVDSVKSYAAIRSVGKSRDTAGNLRLTLNGAPIFHLGPLDQGWWPDGLLTPPSEEAILFELKWLKDAGFNMLRKHIKVEPRRYYYHCDRLGLLVWQDQVSGGASPPWTFLEPKPTDAVWSDADHAQYMAELEQMIDLLEFFPSIVVWVPFNEAWGQHRTVDVGKWTQARDPSRLVNIASGGNFWEVGDIADRHNYPHPDFPFDAPRYKDYVQVVGEFGGHGWPVPDHLWKQSKQNWGYGGLPATPEEYQARYRESMARLQELKARGVSAGVYTQTTDVEGEINGLMTYDRKVIKIPAAELKQIHQPLIVD